MKLDLNGLLEEIYSWKSVVKKKDEIIEDLQNEIKESKQCIEVLKTSNNSLLLEIGHFNNVIATLHQTLSQIEECEMDKRRLIEEKLTLEKDFNEKEKNFQLKVDELKKEIVKLNDEYRENIAKQVLEIDTKVSSQLQSYCITLRDKENQIRQLENDILKLKNEKNQELLKMKIEYEEKLNKLKSKMGKSKGSHHYNKTDIFRQKYTEKEKEAKEESLKLKQEIEKLQEELILLKSSNNTLLKQNDTQLDSLTSPPKEINDFQDLERVKRQKLNDNCSNDFIPVSSNNNLLKQTNIVHHFRKKLFNLDMNYFDK